MQALSAKEKYHAELVKYKKTEYHKEYTKYLIDFKSKNAAASGKIFSEPSHQSSCALFSEGDFSRRNG